MTDTIILNDILLGLLARGCDDDLRARVAPLSLDDWSHILERGGQHRCLPMLHWRLEQGGALAGLPEQIREEFYEGRMQQTVHALTVQSDLLRLHRLLESAGIPHVFLKGAYLAQFVYPSPALRPVRDIDVIVPPDEAVRAQKMLLDAGYTGRELAKFSAEKASKHLPRLTSPTSGIHIEVHFSVDAPGGPLAGLDAFLAVNTRTLANAALPFMDPTDLLIHLCVHACAMHGFDNGPLVIADLIFLLEREGLDAAKIERRAGELGVRRPVALVLALVENCADRKFEGLANLTHGVPDDLIRGARRLCLNEQKHQKQIRLLSDVAAHGGSKAHLDKIVSKLFPPARYLELEFGRAQNRLQQGFLYVRRWRRILFDRLPAVIKARTRTTFALDFENTQALKTWLQTPDAKASNRS